jgi:Protein of unknown function with HXXEE motif
MDFYRKHWPDVGVGLATGIGIAMTIFMMLSRKKRSRAQVLSALNLVALLLHQCEEYRVPGYFPGQFNAGVLKSEMPDHYPLNTQLAMIINTVLAYPVYALPVLFPRKVWLGLAPVLMGFGQVLIHGIVFPLRARARYGPGFVTALCLHLPIGIAYIRQIAHEQPVKRSDWMKGVISFIGFAVGGIAAPILLLRDKESPYRFTEQQMGPYGHQ